MATRLNEGRYRGRVVGQALTESGGTPCVEITLTVTHQLGAGGLTVLPNGSVRRTVRLWLTKDSLAVTKRSLMLLGGVPERFGQLDPSALDAIYYTGREVDLECAHREYDGQTREEWGVVGPPSTLSAERVADLDAQLGALLKGEAQAPAHVAEAPTYS